MRADTPAQFVSAVGRGIFRLAVAFVQDDNHRIRDGSLARSESGGRGDGPTCNKVTSEVPK